MLVEVMEQQHVMEAARTFPNPVALNGGFVLQPGPRYLVLRYVHEYEDIQVAVLGYREFGGYLNFYDPMRTLPVISDRLISMVNLVGSSFLVGRESVPRVAAPAGQTVHQPVSDTAVPFNLPPEETAPIAAAAAVGGAAAVADMEDDSGDDDLDALLNPTAADDTDFDMGSTDAESDDFGGDDMSLDDLGGPAVSLDDDPFDIPDDSGGDDLEIDDLDALLGSDDGSDDLDIAIEDDGDDPLADLGFGDLDMGDDSAKAAAPPPPPADDEPLSQDSIDDLFA